MTETLVPSDCPIAFIMSVYGKDDPELFDRALRSIFAQDYDRGPVRLYLCVDGRLTDALETVLARYEDRIYKLVRNEENQGLAASLNRLIGLLEGEAFVLRMDSDDVSRPDRAEKQINAMCEAADVDILGGAITEMGPDGKVQREIRFPSDQDAIVKRFAWRSPLAHPSVCFRRSAIEKFKSYPTPPVAQDVALWFKCYAMGLKISNIEDIVVDMSVSDGFYKRRGAERAWAEALVWMAGIRRVWGINWRLIFPLLRFCFRLAPGFVVRLAYRHLPR